MKSTRPVLRYHGGKWRLAPWIISYFPEHRTYVEPFGGAASVLMQKRRSWVEVYNDLDGEIVNLFRVLRNPAQARELIRLVTLTPYARSEFESSYITADDPIEQARRTMFRSYAGFSTIGATGAGRTGFRSNTTRSWKVPSDDWRNLPAAMNSIVDRLRGVIIENDSAVNVIERYDNPQALFYIDPPYPASTRCSRTGGAAYRHEMNDDDHRELAAALHRCSSYVVISGYACDLYDNELYPDWCRVERDTHADGARDRTEVLWMNRRQHSTLPLFANASNPG